MLSLFAVALFSWVASVGLYEREKSREASRGDIACLLTVLFSVVAALAFAVSCIWFLFASYRGYAEHPVYIVDETGMVRKSDDDYYLDGEGNYYIRESSAKEFFVPFYRAKYEKVETPAFEYGNLIVRDTSTGNDTAQTQCCPNCSNELDAGDKFCSVCGTPCPTVINLPESSVTPGEEAGD